MDMCTNEKFLTELKARLETIESELKTYPGLYKHDRHLLRVLVTKTLAISVEISSYAKKEIRTTSSLLEIAALLKRQSAIVRAVCKLQRQSVQMHRRSTVLDLAPLALTTNSPIKAA